MLFTAVVVGVFGTIAILYARGFRIKLDEESVSFGPTGILVANSEPTGAQVFIDEEIKTATNNSISLPPKTYRVLVKKEGFLPWEKLITIQKETVTQIDAFLVSSAPSLTALTFSGVINPVASEDFSKIAYVIPKSTDYIEKAGLWVMEAVNLPLGFNRDPRRITDGDLTDANYEFSPDGREILLTNLNSVYLLDVGKFTPQSPISNSMVKPEKVKEEWKKIRQTRLKAKIAALPDEIEDIFIGYTRDVFFSPDENRILYTATGTATIPEGIARQLPGSSTQKEERQVTSGRKYVYDIREDKNFKVGNEGEILYWLPNSLNLVIPEENKIAIIDYDGTNRKTVFSGSYIYPVAYPSTSTGRLLILTNFGSSDSLTNLYWLSLK